MKKHFLKCTLILFTLFFFSSCNKDEDKNTVNETENGLPENVYPISVEDAEAALHNGAAKKWKATAFNLSSVGSQDCRLDDEMVFNSDGSYQYNNGSKNCGGDVGTKNGVYTFLFDEKQLVFDPGTSDERIADIGSLSKDRIVVNGSWSVFQIGATFQAE